MDCPKCGSAVPSMSRVCVACQFDVGFPNVRAASAREEEEALKARVDKGLVSARARKCEEVLNKFGDAVLQSQAVIARSLELVLTLVSSDSGMYVSFQQQVEAGIRLPEDNEWDAARGAANQILFPNYARHIAFAALSLDGGGLTHYGAYAIVLREGMIEGRATVFEENSLRFVQRLRIVPGTPVPRGYRAVWSARGRLAVAKLHHRLDVDTNPDDFPSILLREGGSGADEDFVEVHIYGPIHRRAIERVIGPPARRGECALRRSLDRKLREVGARLEIR